jgi:hypothetical protein
VGRPTASRRDSARSCALEFVPTLAGRGHRNAHRPNTNGGKPGFSPDIAKDEKSAALAFAYVGAYELVKGTALSVAGNGLAAGTFKGKTSALSGSWNCHGVIDKS